MLNLLGNLLFYSLQFRIDVDTAKHKEDGLSLYWKACKAY